MSDVVDAHHHVWGPDLSPHTWLEGAPALQRPFSLADYVEAGTPVGVRGSILVQVLPEEKETIDFLLLASKSELVWGVVGFADLLKPEAGRRLDALRSVAGGDLLVGLREAAGRSPAWFALPALLDGLEEAFSRGLVVDLLLRPQQLRAAAHLAARFPGAPIVLDHAGCPEIDSGELQPWADDLAELASHPGVRCKVSGLVTLAGERWSEGGILPYVEVLVRSFGSGRLLYGSDWPVCTQVAPLGEVLDTTRRSLEQVLNPGEVADVLALNAIRTYALADEDDGLTNRGARSS